MFRLKVICILRFLLFINICLLCIGLILKYFDTSLIEIPNASSEDFYITLIKASDWSAESRLNQSEFRVPNIVHYIWYAEQAKPLQFHQMLCILSSHKHIRPSSILFHTNLPPVGKYWQYILGLDILKVVYRSPPTHLFGERVKQPVFYTSHSNVDRVKLLMEMGGIYLDLDMLVTRSFDDLRRHACTIGREQKTKACGSVVVCAKDSPFLFLWINSYLDDYRINEWAYNSGQVPFNLALRFPHLVNMEETKLNRPNFQELDLIWGEGRFPWRRNYAVHLWYRLWKDRSPLYRGTEPNETNIGNWPGTFGEMARKVLFGDARVTKRNYAV